MKKLVVIFSCFCFLAGTANADTSLTVMVIGQSNPAGRAKVLVEDLHRIPGVFILNNNRFVPARTPLNQYSRIKREYATQKYSFVNELFRLLAEDYTVYGVVQARGGSDIACWSRGGECYDSTIDLVKRNDLIIAGVFIHQGESDRRNKRYPVILARTITNLREDLGVDCPVVVGEIAPCDYDAVLHNRRLQKIYDMVENVRVVSSDGLTTLGPYHFDTASSKELGRRYYDAFLELH